MERKGDILKEFSRVRQIGGQGFRRWFSSSTLELIVWYQADKKTLTGFQFCYDENHALTWTRREGYEHSGIDSGDVRTLSGTGMTPILIPDGVFDSASIAERFRHASVMMDKELAAFIYDTLKNYRATNELRQSGPTPA